jgi:hypothetical protein
MREKWIDLLEKKFRFKKCKIKNICSTTICCIGCFDADYKIQLMDFVVGVFLLSKNNITRCRPPPLISLKKIQIDWRNKSDCNNKKRIKL